MAHLATNITHVSRMDTLGGIERLLQAFVNAPGPEISHALFLTGRKIHPALRPDDSSFPISYSRYASGIYIPRPFRRFHQNRVLNSIRPEVISFWGYPTTNHDQMRFPPEARLIYQEHGSCWDMEVTERKKDFLKRMNGITCCSFAARRMLELRWNCSAKMTVVQNPVSPHALSADAQPKILPGNHPVILGTAGRLVPYKATVLALFALKHLLESGIDCWLRVAGTGTLLNPLRIKAAQLGLEARVDFAGAVSDMRAFYKNIDFFLLPSIREPLGLVAVEAMASGCPVIATAVDGVPEAVQNGKTGFCIQPELTMKEYQQLAGAEFSGKYPEVVYDPATDSLRPPLAPHPFKLAGAIKELIENPVLYEAASRTAIDDARQNFSFNTYCKSLKAALLAS